MNAATEFADNVIGGTRRGATFADRVGIGVNVNWESLAGITGLATKVRSGATQFWIVADQILVRNDKSDANGLMIWEGSSTMIPTTPHMCDRISRG